MWFEVFEGSLLTMGVDDRAAELDDLTPAAELVDQEGMEVLDVRYCDVQEEVVSAGQDEDGHDLGHGQRIAVEGGDEISTQWSDLGEHHGLYRTAEAGQVHGGVESCDDLGRLQSADPFGAGRGCDSDDLCEVAHGNAGVSLQLYEDCSICPIEVRIYGHLPNISLI
jgi:hypothetical protein